MRNKRKSSLSRQSLSCLCFTVNPQLKPNVCIYKAETITALLWCCVVGQRESLSVEAEVSHFCPSPRGPAGRSLVGWLWGAGLMLTPRSKSFFTLLFPIISLCNIHIILPHILQRHKNRSHSNSSDRVLVISQCQRSQ